MDLDTALTVLKIAAPLGAVVLGAIYSDAIRERLAPLAFRLGSRKTDVRGLWLATFSYEHGAERRSYDEVIEISKSLGFVVGRIVPHKLNHERLKETEPGGKTIEESRPVRITAKFAHNHYLTGYWFHPSQRSHFHGAFQLMVDQSYADISIATLSRPSFWPLVGAPDFSTCAYWKLTGMRAPGHQETLASHGSCHPQPPLHVRQPTFMSECAMALDRHCRRSRFAQRSVRQ